MPKSIVKRANVILGQLEGKSSKTQKAFPHLGEPKGASPTAHHPSSDTREGMQLSFFQLDDPVLTQIRDEIIGLDINNLTPVEALNKLNDIRKIVTGK